MLPPTKIKILACDTYKHYAMCSEHSVRFGISGFPNTQSCRNVQGSTEGGADLSYISLTFLLYSQFPPTPETLHSHICLFMSLSI